jgi:hypothetical protein
MELEKLAGPKKKNCRGDSAKHWLFRDALYLNRYSELWATGVLSGTEVRSFSMKFRLILPVVSYLLLPYERYLGQHWRQALKKKTSRDAALE